MIEARPDWVISRQRAWGVPITVFVHKETGEVIPSASVREVGELMERIRRPSPRRARMPGSSRAPPSASSKGWSPIRPSGARRPTSSTCGSISAPRMPSRWRTRGVSGPRRHPPRARRRHGPRHVPGRLRPASRLVPVVAAGELRHARARALRRRADARLHPRREGRGEDVEVEGQHHVAAGHHEELRRRHPAPVGGVLGLFERYPLRARHHPGNGRVLSQAPQHAALDARHAGPLRPQEDGGREGDAGAGAADAAPADRARRGRSARPTPSTTTSAWWRC